jgi:hypothetical protein
MEDANQRTGESNMPKTLADEMQAWEEEEAARRAADYDRAQETLRQKMEAERARDAAQAPAEEEEEEEEDTED